MKYILTIMLCIGFFTTTMIQAQEETKEETKKVVIVKKTKDPNGKTIMKRQEASGKEADELIKQMKKDGTLEGIDIDIEIEKAKADKKSKKSVERRISIQEKEENGKTVKTYEVITVEDGEKKVMKWSGDGEMPEEMAKIIEEEENKKVVKEEKETTTFEIITEDGDDTKVMFWSGDGEMPKEMEEVLKDVKIVKKRSDDGKTMTITVETDEDAEIHEEHEEIIIEKRVKKENTNKVTLGVMIANDDKGAVVSDIKEGSVAEQAGIKAGDTIIKVGDTYVFNMDMLLAALSPFDKGDKTEVTVLRDGKEKKVKAKF